MWVGGVFLVGCVVWGVLLLHVDRSHVKPTTPLKHCLVSRVWPAATGVCRSYLVVWLHDCDQEPCVYGLGLFGHWPLA